MDQQWNQDSVSFHNSVDTSKLKSLVQPSLIKMEETELVKELTNFVINCLESGGSRKISIEGWVVEVGCNFP